MQQSKQSATTATRLAVFFVAFFVWFSPAIPLFAQDVGNDTFGLQQISQNTVLGGADIRLIIARIINAALGLLGTIALGLILYAGFVIMTSGGDEEKIAQARKILKNAVIGLAIILSAFTIVQYVISKLSQAVGIQGGTGGGGAPAIESFSGSGSLGPIVRDHYPFRDQTGVARNTKIAVTFAEPIDAASIIDDTNKSETLGDCVTAAGQTFDARRDCDHLMTANVVITPSSTDKTSVQAAALTTYDAKGNAVTFVFKPFDFLGDNIQPVAYQVLLTDKINKADGKTSAFLGQRTPNYQWDFETGTTYDYSAPTVVGVSPASGASIARNVIIQINFSEPMDPSSVQGVAGSDFTNIIFDKNTVKGEWRISNGYKTVEFVSSDPCGLNSCGQQMFCLPVVCAQAGCANPYRSLIRTAQLDGTGTFQSFPFTGVADMAGNALDGNADGKPQGQPAVVGDRRTILSGDEKADNYLWKYAVKDEIDRSIPYVTQVAPAVDQGGVKPADPVKIYFNKVMMGSTLGDIRLEEYREDGSLTLDPLWYRPLFTDETGQTVVTFDHRGFGPNNTDYYYFTSVPSTVKSNNQNCLYPGYGPDGSAASCAVTFDASGNPTTPTNCVPVTLDAARDTGCAQTVNPADASKPDVSACIKTMKDISKNTTP